MGFQSVTGPRGGTPRSCWDRFVTTGWAAGIQAQLNPILISRPLATELADLVRAARDERAEALGEILSEDVEFISEFMELLTITPGSHPNTYRALHVASTIGSFAAVRFKGIFNRPRPSYICPALLPPIPVPGHSAFPSGHATQSRLMWRVMRQVLRRGSTPRNRGHAAALRGGCLGGRPRRFGGTQRGRGIWNRSSSPMVQG